MSDVLSRAGPVRIALLHPQGAWVEALELLLLQRDDVDVVMAHTSPDWVRGSVESGVDVLVVALWRSGRVPARGHQGDAPTVALPRGRGGE